MKSRVMVNKNKSYYESIRARIRARKISWDACIFFRWLTIQRIITEKSRIFACYITELIFEN